MAKTIELNFRELFEAVPGLYLILTPDPRFQIIGVSDAYTKATLTTREMIIGKALFDIFPDNPDDPTANATNNLRASLMRVLKTRAPDRMDIQKYDVRRPAKDGGGFEMKVWSPYNVPVLNADGTIHAIIHQVEDITDLIKLKEHGIEQAKIMRANDLARKSIENERLNFRTLFKQTPEMVCILKGPHHLFEFVNEAHVKVLGFDATGLTMREAQPESIEVHHILDDVYKTGNTAELFEIPVTIQDKRRYFNVTYAPRRDENGFINGIMVLGTEVTYQIKARESLRSSQEILEKAVRARDEFLSIASHELRTPLTAMKMQTQMFNRFINKDSKAALNLNNVVHMIGNIESGLNRLVRLVEDMLDISRIQIGKLAFQTERIEVAPFLNDVIKGLRPQLEKAGIQLRTALEPNIFVELDRLRIEQVLTNIIMNVIRYAPEAPLEIALKKSGNFALFCFQDHGKGIPNADKDRVFIQFERLVSADNISGLGLGLFICKKIIEGHRGSIHLEDGEDGGARFVIKLPLA